MKIVETPIAGLNIVESAPIADSRGSFARWFCEEQLASILGQRRIVQINHSRTLEKGTVRGMHYQMAPHAEMKLIRCLRGRVFDVALDLRAKSPTFLQWHAVELAAGDNRMIVIPEGFAHGFQVLEEGSELLYLHTAAYAPAAEAGIRHSDERAAIAWPRPPINLSERDKNYPPLDQTFTGL